MPPAVTKTGKITIILLKGSSDGRKVLVKVMRMFLAIYTSLKRSSKT